MVGQVMEIVGLDFPEEVCYAYFDKEEAVSLLQG